MHKFPGIKVIVKAFRYFQSSSAIYMCTIYTYIHYIYCVNNAMVHNYNYTEVNSHEFSLGFLRVFRL